RIEPLEWLVDTYGRTSDSFRLPDALAQLGDAYAAQGDFERAKEVLEKLVDREPESDSAKRKLNEVLRKMGAGSAPSVPEHAFESLQAEIPQPEAPKIRPQRQSPPQLLPPKKSWTTKHRNSSPSPSPTWISSPATA